MLQPGSDAWMAPRRKRKGKSTHAPCRQAMGGLLLLGVVLTVLCFIRLNTTTKPAGAAHAPGRRGRPLETGVHGFLKVWLAGGGVHRRRVKRHGIGGAATGAMALAAGQQERWLWMFVNPHVRPLVGTCFFASAPACAYREAACSSSCGTTSA